MSFACRGSFGKPKIWTMKAIYFFAMALFVSTLNLLASEETGKGVVQLQYEPRVCVMAPCPQFKVISVNRKPVTDLGADVLNFEYSRSAARAFKTFSVKGTWVQKENYLEITASSWHTVVGEKLDQGSIPPKK